MQYSSFAKFSLIFFSLISLFSCGQGAHAPGQDSRSIPSPQYPTYGNEIFRFNNQKIHANYRGTMLLINEDTTPELLAEVISASLESRIAWAKMRKFEAETDYVKIYGDRGIASESIKSMQNTLWQFEKDSLEKNPIDSDKRHRNISTWLNRELDSVYLESGVNEAWGAYCEAKILELALQPLFAKNNYQELPSPNPLCEKYFEEKQIFKGETCSQNESVDYFQCLWIDGVLKTRWYDRNKSQDMAKKNDEISSLVTNSSIALRSVLQMNPEAINPSLIKGDFFVRLGLSEARKDGPEASNVKRCLIGIKNPKTKGICQIFGLSPHSVHPQEWIDAFEGRALNSKLISFKKTTSLRTISTQQLIRYMAERRLGANSELDRLFHKPINGVTLPDPNFGSDKEFLSLLPRIRSILGIELYGSLSDQDKLEKKEKEARIDYLLKKVELIQSDWKKYDDKINATTNKGFLAANKETVAHAFMDIRFSFKQSDSILQGDFWINKFERKIFRACINLNSFIKVMCTQNPNETGNFFQDAELNVDPYNGQINFTFVITDPANMGFTKTPRFDPNLTNKPDFFVDIGAEVFKNKRMEFEIFPNKMLGHLNILTGKAFLRDSGGTPLYEAGVSIWETP